MASLKSLSWKIDYGNSIWKVFESFLTNNKSFEVSASTVNIARQLQIIRIQLMAMQKL